MLQQDKLNAFITLIHKNYPAWGGFSDPKFMKEEVNYKQNTISKAKDQLSKIELQKLIAEENYEEFITRLENIAKDNNLLWRPLLNSGDANILYQPGLNKASFCQAIFDLIYGQGLSNERLGHYLDYVQTNKLPSKWTFPTYFLFICHPDTEFFVKPTILSWLLNFFNIQDKTISDLTAESYSTIRQLADELKEGLKAYHPRDMVDIQGVVYVCAKTSDATTKILLDEEKRVEFNQLYQEFVDTYLKTAQGQRHITTYDHIRKQAKQNYEEIINAVDQGDDVTEQVLLKLLPYTDSLSNQQKGAWIHIAPSITGDLQLWFQSNGWAKPDDWPQIARAILQLIKLAIEDPSQLSKACNEFAELTFIKGFQTGMLTPILSALRPEDYILINNKSRKVVNYLTGQNHIQSIKEYPATNNTAKELISEVANEIHKSYSSQIRDTDLFDMFSHWLVAEKKFDFNTIHYWKVSPGENAWQWSDCHNNQFIAIGWDEIGDISKLSRSQFEQKRDELITKNKDWGSKNSVEQVWKFAHIREGDRIVANKGTTQVLGIGTVVGPYFFVSQVENGHRLPVEWDDVTIRNVNKGGWRRALIELNKEDFKDILSTEQYGGSVETNPDCPFSQKTFKLLDGLTANPTKGYYQEHKPDFLEFLEEPFKKLLLNVGEALPIIINNSMETKKRLFSIIPKNDYGQGGAWNYYWGAFYPKHGKRTRDAQLFLWLNSASLQLGFNIGDYGSDQRKRFLHNCQHHYAVLVEVLNNSLIGEDFVFGHVDQQSPDNATCIALQDWLKNPEELGIIVSITLSKDNVLTLSFDELREQISTVFMTLYPLVILATSDDPLSDIADYLGKDEEEELNPEYSLEQCSIETSIEEGVLSRWIRAIERKGQAILYGPPGTGKTYLAERLAKHLISDGQGFYEIVQFHPAYAYEDFVQGIRPQARIDGGLHYPVVPGRFMEFCKKASSLKGRCVLIIDEINRANLARVFGELMYLLEYRDGVVPLANGGTFSIPQNVRLIGTMNTADRSIALVDHALRRRFAFLALYPNFDILRKFHTQTGFQVEGLIETLERLNKDIGDRHYEIGVSFLLRDDLQIQIEDVWRMEIEPYLEEYFFDQPDKVNQFRWDMIKGKVLK